MKLRLPTPSDVQHKRVIVRVGFDVPLEGSGKNLTVADDQRIQAALPTIQFLLENQAKVILISHLGRPAGNGYEAQYSLKPVAEYLQTLLPAPVTFCTAWTGAEAKTVVDELQEGEVLLLENLRFDEGEEKNTANFAQGLAKLGDVYINDAFSVSHRSHASIVGLTKYLPSFAGFDLAKEVEALSVVRDNPKRPLIVVIGGAKISDKVEAIVNLADVADLVLIGGGIANNFMKAEGLEIHKSFVQDAPADLKKKGHNYINVAEDLLAKMKTEKVWVAGYIPVPKILYPLDVIAAPSPDSTDTQIIDLTHNSQDRPENRDLMYLDIGPKTRQLYRELISYGATIFWNGPMGMFEKPQFAEGTKEIAQTIASNTGKAVTVLGGGDTLAAVNDFGLTGKYTYVSTAGGASLDFLAGKDLPGLKPLEM